MAAAAEISAAQIKLLLSEIGERDNDDLYGAIPGLCELYADKALLGIPRLLYLYVKRGCIDGLLGGNWKRVTHEYGDEKEQDSDRSKNLRAMREAVQADIDAAESGGSASIGAVSGQLSTETPVSAPTYGPDPSSRLYRGDPLLR